MTKPQASSQAISSLHAVPQGSEAESDWNSRLVVILEQLQQQVADLQSIVIAQGFTGSVTISGTTLTFVHGVCTST